MYTWAIRLRECECWLCAVADARRIIAEALEMAGDVEPATPFEE